MSRLGKKLAIQSFSVAAADEDAVSVPVCYDDHDTRAFNNGEYDVKGDLNSYLEFVASYVTSINEGRTYFAPNNDFISNFNLKAAIDEIRDGLRKLLQRKEFKGKNKPKPITILDFSCYQEPMKQLILTILEPELFSTAVKVQPVDLKRKEKISLPERGIVTSCGSQENTYAEGEFFTENDATRMIEMAVRGEFFRLFSICFSFQACNIAASKVLTPEEYRIQPPFTAVGALQFGGHYPIQFETLPHNHPLSFFSRREMSVTFTRTGRPVGICPSPLVQPLAFMDNKQSLVAHQIFSERSSNVLSPNAIGVHWHPEMNNRAARELFHQDPDLLREYANLAGVSEKQLLQQFPLNSGMLDSGIAFTAAVLLSHVKSLCIEAGI